MDSTELTCSPKSHCTNTDQEEDGSQSPWPAPPALPIHVGDFASKHTYSWRLDEELAEWVKEVKQRNKARKSQHRKAEAKW
eukprot:CAMPEP_0196589990 /NCGR_PEP_ID=MMETSP1081-20130531/65192_1 /TAXON_ID=36882 /ORGANISM="Pyramimonas amylifera, Strain CCMP720" /LENGTH=80 /DNA_ID=CAMNT_0041912947 /DNA_START=458 /DNA_END=697 /DNA_ORIENTATION=-